MRRSEPQPSPAAPAHAAGQPAQAAQYRARSGTVEASGLDGLIGRCAALQRATRRRASGGMSACYCFRNGVMGG
eukprot:3673767-Prymnesium_polylepis.1